MWCLMQVGAVRCLSYSCICRYLQGTEIKGRRMGSSSSTANSVIQKQLNQILNESNAKCNPTCQQVQSGNTVFLVGSTVGNVTFDQTCNVDMTCTIQNSVQSAIDATQAAVQNGSASPSWFLGVFQDNEVRNLTDQEVSNNIKNVLNSTCGTNVDQVQTGNLVYAQNSTTGNIGFNQNSDIHAQCVLNNLATGQITTNQQASQTAKAGGLGLGAIVTIVLVIVIIIVAIFLIKGLSGQKQGGGGGGSPTVGNKQQNRQLAADAGASGMLGPEAVPFARAAKASGKV